MRRYEAGQAEANTGLQRQVAQLQAENDQLRLQLADMSRAHPQGASQQAHQANYRVGPPLTQPPLTTQSSHQRAASSSLEQQLYYPDSDLRPYPTSPRFDAAAAGDYSPDSMSSLASPTLPLQQSTRNPPITRLDHPESSQRTQDDPSARLSSFESMGARHPYARPTGGGPTRMPFVDMTSSSAQSGSQQQQSLPAISSWPTATHLPSPWQSLSTSTSSTTTYGSQPPHQRQQQQQQQQQQHYGYASNFSDRRGRP